MLNNALILILGICIFIGIVFLIVVIYQICKCIKDIKVCKKEIKRLVVEVFNAFEIGEVCTIKSGQEIILTDKFEENGKYYFKYKYFNEDAETIAEITSDEEYVVTVQQFSHLIK